MEQLFNNVKSKITQRNTGHNLQANKMF